METTEDLLKLIKFMPHLGRMEFLNIVQRMGNNRITPKQATKQLEALMIQYKIIEYPEVSKP